MVLRQESCDRRTGTSATRRMYPTLPKQSLRMRWLTSLSLPLLRKWYQYSSYRSFMVFTVMNPFPQELDFLCKLILIDLEKKAGSHTGKGEKRKSFNQHCMLLMDSFHSFDQQWSGSVMIQSVVQDTVVRRNNLSLNF